MLLICIMLHCDAGHGCLITITTLQAQFVVIGKYFGQNEFLVVIIFVRVAPYQAKPMNTSWRQVHAGWSIQVFLENSYVSSILIMNIGISVRPAKKLY